MRSSTAAVLILVALAACGEGTAPTGGLDARAEHTELFEGRSTPLSAMLDGQPVDASEVQWLSRDPATVEVIGSVAHAKLPGITWLVARVGALTDSVRVGVRFAALGPNRLGIFIGGEIEQRFSLGGASMLFELPNSRTHTIVHATAGRPAHSNPDDIFAGDTVVSLRLIGTPAPGVRQVPPIVVEDREEGGFAFLGSEGLIMRISKDEPGRHITEFYVAVTDSPLEFTTVELPVEAGVDFGVLGGRTAFDAAGFRVVYPYPTSPGATPPAPYMEQISDRTIRIYIEFSTDWYRVPVPMSNLRVEGTPYVGDSHGGGLARMRSGAVEIYQDMLVNFREPNERYIQATMTLAAPATGTFDMAAPGARLNTSFSIFQRTVPEFDSGEMVLESTAVARTGTVTITEYRAPTDRAYGLIAGSYTAALDFGAAHPNHAVTITSNFRIPIDPLLGVPTDASR